MMDRRNWFKIQIQLNIGIVGIALFLTALKVIFEMIAVVEFGLTYFVFTPQITIALISIASLFISVRTELSLKTAWVAGFLYLWATLALINQDIVLTLVNRGLLALSLYLLIVPLPLAISSLIGALFGKILKWIFNQKPSDPSHNP